MFRKLSGSSFKCWSHYSQRFNVFKRFRWHVSTRGWGGIYDALAKTLDTQTGPNATVLLLVHYYDWTVKQRTLLLHIPLNVYNNSPPKRADQDAVWANWFCINFGKKVAKPLVTMPSVMAPSVTKTKTGFLINMRQAVGASLILLPKSALLVISSLPLWWTWDTRSLFTTFAPATTNVYTCTLLYLVHFLTNFRWDTASVSERHTEGLRKASHY